MGGIAENERTNEIRPPLIKRLGDQPADGKAADDRLANREHVEKAGKVIGVVFDRVRDGADIGETVAALVVENDRVFAGKAHDDITPDPEVGAERIGKDQHRSLGRGADDLIVDGDVVDAGKLHGTSPLQPNCLFNLVR
ncbi:hypothetical protein D9M72_607910 [compost metagenome]